MVFPRTQGREGAVAALAVALAVVLGIAIAFAPVAGLALPAALVVWACTARPAAVASVSMVSCAVYSGVYLTYRLNAGSLPVSALDAIPPCLLLAAFAASAKHRTHVSVSAGWVSVALFVGGIVVGTVTAVDQLSADSVRVLRIELLLLIGLVAGLLGGRSEAWSAGIVRGLIAAALIAAALQLLSAGFQVVFGYPFWSLLPFGATNVAGFADAGRGSSGSNTRDNFLPLFVMLPAIGLFAYRLQPRDQVRLALLVVAAVASLSRSMWFATIIVLATAWLARRAAGHQRSFAKPAALVASLTVALLGASVFGGGFIEARATSSLSGDDISSSYRETETRQTLAELSKHPASWATGLGVGVFIPAIGYDHADPTPILENQMLARLTNLGLLSVLATITLLLGASIEAIRTLRAVPDDPLAALALTFPAVLAISMISGVVLLVQASLPFWVLAGAIIVSGRNTRLRAERTPV